jgi:hypothetical protein
MPTAAFLLGSSCYRLLPWHWQPHEWCLPSSPSPLPPGTRGHPRTLYSDLGAAPASTRRCRLVACGGGCGASAATASAVAARALTAPSVPLLPDAPARQSLSSLALSTAAPSLAATVSLLPNVSSAYQCPSPRQFLPGGGALLIDGAWWSSPPLGRAPTVSRPPFKPVAASVLHLVGGCGSAPTRQRPWHPPCWRRLVLMSSCRRPPASAPVTGFPLRRHHLLPSVSAPRGGLGAPAGQAATPPGARDVELLCWCHHPLLLLCHPCRSGWVLLLRSTTSPCPGPLLVPTIINSGLVGPSVWVLAGNATPSCSPYSAFSASCDGARIPPVLSVRRLLVAIATFVDWLCGGPSSLLV